MEITHIYQFLKDSMHMYVYYNICKGTNVIVFHQDAQATEIAIAVEEEELVLQRRTVPQRERAPRRPENHAKEPHHHVPIHHHHANQSNHAQNAALVRRVID